MNATSMVKNPLLLNMFKITKVFAICSGNAASNRKIFPQKRTSRSYVAR